MSSDAPERGVGVRGVCAGAATVAAPASSHQHQSLRIREMLKWDFDKGLEYADKMRPILASLDNGEIWFTLSTWRIGSYFRVGSIAKTLPG